MDEKEFASGSIIGACLGDALGAVLEFGWPYSKKSVDEAMNLPGVGRLRVGEGQFTDDGELTMCQVIVFKNKSPSNGFLGDELLSWYKRWVTNGPFDMGLTTTTALVYKTKQSFLDHIERIKRVNANSKANGSMLRMTPLSVWSRNLPLEKRVEYYRLDSQLTRPNQSVLDACCAYGLAVSTLINHKGNISNALLVLEEWINQHTNQEVREWFEGSKMDNLGEFKVYPQAAFVRWGFTLAFYFLRTQKDFETSIEQTLALGGDTDTNAAIVGGIVGAMVGKGQLPSNLVDKMINYEIKEGDLRGWKRPDYLSPRKLLHWIDKLFDISR